ncbi:MAG: hypothetical protein LBC52_08045 [Treponema sp.]|jgi:hypothetical protein|nr:hypothetical protein [Treponema sp.]
MKNDFSCIICVADINITRALDQCLAEAALPEVFIQRAKQMSLEDKHGFLGRQITNLEESRAVIYRLYVPSEYETGLVNRIIDATDLKMGGRGCLIVQHIDNYRSNHLSFITEKMDKLLGRSGRAAQKEHALISCIVPRGEGNTLAEALLELGICVPIIFYGTGVGLRDRLGLLRITVPIEKEIIWFIVPAADAILVEKIIIPRAGLDIPGKGFMYTMYIHAPVVNLRVRHGKRAHAATMEQIIAALDEVRGSSDWRRFGSRKHDSASKNRSSSTRALFFIGEEEDVEIFRNVAIESGARGATLNELEMRSYTAETQDEAKESHSRLLCDIVTTRAVEEKIMEQIAKTDLLSGGRHCGLKTFDVEMPSVIRK